VISVTRLINQGLILVSPIVLVRLLSVEQFGRYREFLLYATVLLSVAAFGINSSLLRFVPDRPHLKWRFVDQAALMTLASSILVTGGALLLDTVFDGKVLGEFALAVALYVLLFVNLDFWEFLWLSERRSFAVLSYTTGRLIARVVTVITTALLTRSVTVITWSLICLEAVRLTISFVGWYSRRERTDGSASGLWREQLEFCLPFGGSQILVSLNRSIGSLFVAKMLGPVALAHYVIGTYVQPIITVLRNSLSDVLLPEMVAKSRDEAGDKLELWRRTTVVTAIFLFAAGVVLARFAHVVVTTLFSEEYLPAVAIFQLYLVTLARESIDFGVPLRAINRTAPILRSNMLAIVLNAVLLVILLPAFGLIGAVAAFVISRLVEGMYLGSQTMDAYELSLRELACWPDLLKVVICAAVAAIVMYGEFWTRHLGLIGAALGGLAYLVTFVALLALARIREVQLFLQYLRSVPAGLARP
jgi:O-antigen/teichoic acid export membrane protein